MNIKDEKYKLKILVEDPIMLSDKSMRGVCKTLESLLYFFIHFVLNTFLYTFNSLLFRLYIFFLTESLA